MEIKQKKAVRPADDFIRIQDLWSLFVPRWGWFVISLVLCLGASALYLAVTPNVYTRYAELLVKDCLLYPFPSPRDGLLSRMPSSA